MDYNNLLDTLEAHFLPHNSNSSPSLFQEPRTTMPPPILGDLPATASAPTAYTFSNSPSAAVFHHPDANHNVPPAANVPRSAISRDLALVATNPPPSVSSLQSPIATSYSAYAAQDAQKNTNPVGHAAPREEMTKDQIKTEPDQDVHLRYRDLPQRIMKKELKRRGLLCGGPNADLARRLEEDDKFQAEARTAEDYDTMSSKDIYNLCRRRSIPSMGTDSELRDRLKTHDKRKHGIEAAEPRLYPLIFPSWPVPNLETHKSHGRLEEKPLMPTVKDEPIRATEIAETIEQTAGIVTPAIHKDNAKSKSINGLLPTQAIHAGNGYRKSKRRCIDDTNRNLETAETVRPASPKERVAFDPKTSMLSTNHRRIACDICRKNKRRCIHDEFGDEDPAKANEPVIPRPTARKAYIKDKTGLMIKHAVLAAEELPETHITRSRLSTAKASTSQSETSRPAQIEHAKKTVKSKDEAPKSRRSHLFYLPKDEIILLQICIKLKEVIGWGNISGFWNMVQDTVQLKTGKPYKKVSRHVRVLVRRRCAEQEEIEQRGEIFVSRVSAGCRPLLDKWIAGGNRIHHALSITSTKPTLDEDKDEVILGEESRPQLGSDYSALEVQKRSATDAWLDTSCDTKRGKKLKLCTSKISYDTSKSSADSVGCWSLSGSSVTSESSVSDEGEGDGDGKDEVKTRSWRQSCN